MSLANTLNPFAGPTLPDVDLPGDTVCDAIGNERRRFILAALFEADGEVTLDDLASERAAIECGPEPSSAARKRVYISMYQCHLRRLDTMGAVVFDRDHGVVAPTEHTDALAQWAQAIEENSREEVRA